MLWQWQVWRCFDDARQTLTAKGWRLLEEVPLAAESGKVAVVFAGLDAETDGCWFELRGGAGPPTAILRGPEDVPTPEEAYDLLSARAAAPRRTVTPHEHTSHEPASLAAGVE